MYVTLFLSFLTFPDMEKASTHLSSPLSLVASPAMVQPETRVPAPRGVVQTLVGVRFAVVATHRVPLLRAEFLARRIPSVVF